MYQSANHTSRSLDSPRLALPGSRGYYPPGLHPGLTPHAESPVPIRPPALFPRGATLGVLGRGSSELTPRRLDPGSRPVVCLQQCVRGSNPCFRREGPVSIPLDQRTRLLQGPLLQIARSCVPRSARRASGWRWPLAPAGKGSAGHLPYSVWDSNPQRSRLKGGWVYRFPQRSGWWAARSFHAGAAHLPPLPADDEPSRFPSGMQTGQPLTSPTGYGPRLGEGVRWGMEKRTTGRWASLGGRRGFTHR